jgi:hypothetical protein
MDHITQYGDYIMPQDSESGARAAQYGKETARKIGETIGAISTSNLSNEFRHKGRLVTIRCAHKTNYRFGTPYNILDRVDAIIGAYEKENGQYELYEITPLQYRENMTDTKSTGRSAGKVGMVSRSYFKKEGKLIGPDDI